MKILSVVGTRPNFIKIAPFIKAINNHNLIASSQPVNEDCLTSIQHTLMHTGQHYDDRMSKSFFDELGIPEPDFNLGIGSGSHAEQVGNTMIEFEKILKMIRPDWVVVVGDVNATLACSITAKKENVKCCHIEAGLRSYDLSMPEEVNRIVTDRICDLLLTPDIIATENLRKEGIPEYKIRFVGNIMIDTLEANRKMISDLTVNDIIRLNLIQGQNQTINIEPGKDNFIVLTLHRPFNVDIKEVLEPIVRYVLDEVCNEKFLIWTLHPRTRKMLVSFGLFDEVLNHKNLFLLEPLSYLEMLKLNVEAKIILTDSGGLQEECTVLGTPCLTLRKDTERPVTLVKNGGAAILTGSNVESIRNEYKKAMGKQWIPFRPVLWDGMSAGRCLNEILNYSLV